MILPVGASSFSEAMRMGSEVYHHLKVGFCSFILEFTLTLLMILSIGRDQKTIWLGCYRCGRWRWLCSQHSGQQGGPWFAQISNRNCWIYREGFYWDGLRCFGILQGDIFICSRMDRFQPFKIRRRSKWGVNSDNVIGVGQEIRFGLQKSKIWPEQVENWCWNVTAIPIIR